MNLNFKFGFKINGKFGLNFNVAKRKGNKKHVGKKVAKPKGNKKHIEKKGGSPFSDLINNAVGNFFGGLLLNIIWGNLNLQLVYGWLILVFILKLSFRIA